MFTSKRSVLTLSLLAAFVVSCAGTQNVGGGVWGQLGGQTGVSALMQSFGNNLSNNPAASQALGSAGIESAKMGLYNSIAKSGGYKVEKNADLLGALKGSNPSPAAVEGIRQSLDAAGKENGLRADQLTALTSLWKPVGKALR